MRGLQPRTGWLLAALAWMPLPTAAAQAGAEIRGGADPTGHHYSWTVTNRSKTGIVELRFPVYAADLFFVPDGWEQEMINRCHLDWKENEPSWCIARRGSTTGIPPGSDAVFGVRIAARGAMIGRGTVTALLADGTETAIADVELPVRPGRPSNLVALVGVGVIFAGWVLVREMRRRRMEAAGPPPSPDADEPPAATT